MTTNGSVERGVRNAPRGGSARQVKASEPCLVALCLLMLGACGGDDVKTTGAIGPSGDVALSISGFLNDRGESFDADATEITLSCDGSISVLFEAQNDGALENWLLRPPGACESFAQCGYIALSAIGSDETVSTAGATTTILLELEPGEYRIEAKLLNADGEEFLQDEAPVTDELESAKFVAPQSCSSTTSSTTGAGGGTTSTTSGSTESTSSSAGGALGTAGAAGAPGTGGAAGAEGLAGAGGQS